MKLNSIFHFLITHLHRHAPSVLWEHTSYSTNLWFHYARSLVYYIYLENEPKLAHRIERLFVLSDFVSQKIRSSSSCGHSSPSHCPQTKILEGVDGHRPRETETCPAQIGYPDFGSRSHVLLYGALGSQAHPVLFQQLEKKRIFIFLCRVELFDKMEMRLERPTFESG